MGAVRYAVLLALMACTPADVDLDDPVESEPAPHTDAAVDSPDRPDSDAPPEPPRAVEVVGFDALGLSFSPVPLPSSWSARDTGASQGLTDGRSRHNEVWLPTDQPGRVICSGFVDLDRCGPRAQPVLDLATLQTAGCLDLGVSARGATSVALRGDTLLFGGSDRGTLQLAKRSGDDWTRVGEVPSPTSGLFVGVTFADERDDVHGFLAFQEAVDEVGGVHPIGLYGFTVGETTLHLTERLAVTEAENTPYTFAYLPAGPNTGTLLITRGEELYKMRLGDEEVVDELIAVSADLQLTPQPAFSPLSDFLSTRPGMQGKLATTAPMGALFFVDPRTDETRMLISSVRFQDPAFAVPSWPALDGPLPERTLQMQLVGEMPTPLTAQGGEYVRQWGMIAVTVAARVDGALELWTILLAAGGDDGGTANEESLELSHMGLFAFHQTLHDGVGSDGAWVPAGSFLGSYTVGLTPPGTFVDVPVANARDLHVALDGTLLVQTAFHYDARPAPATLLRLVPTTDRCQVWAVSADDPSAPRFEVEVRDGEEVRSLSFLGVSHGVETDHDRAAVAHLLVTCDGARPVQREGVRVVEAAR